MKNIILCGYPNNVETAQLIDSLTNNFINVRAVITSDENSYSPIGIEYISHSTISNRYSKINFQEEDYSALGFLSDKYSFIMRCMSRWDESITNNDDRLFMIDSIYLYFIMLLRNEKIQLVFYGTGTPHHFYNLLLSLSAKYLNISNVYPINNWINNRVRFVLEDYNHTIPIKGFGDDDGKMSKYLENICFSSQILTSQAQRVFSDKTTSNYLIFLFTILLPQILGRIKFILSNGKDLYLKNSNGKISRVFAYVIHIMNSQIFKLRFRKKYFKYTDNKARPCNSIILYAMNQPEATSHPDGGFYPDYLYWVFFLKKFGKPIYYKEHKANFIHHTDKDIVDTYKHRSLYYLDFFIKNRVSLISESYSTTQLLADGNDIFTLSGSVILESTLRGKTVYYPGIPFHGDLPGVETVISNNFIKLKKTSILSYEEVVNHFNILESYSIPNYGAFSTSVKENVNYKICLEHIGNVLLWVFQNKNN